MTPNTAGNVKGIDVSAKKKPGGAMVTVSLTNNGGHWSVIGVQGAPASEFQFMSEIGKLVAGLISGDITGATIQVGPGGPGGR
jgi:hypothetical protein